MNRKLNNALKNCKCMSVQVCMYLLGQVLATFSTQTLHHYRVAALFDSDNHTSKNETQTSALLKKQQQSLNYNILIVLRNLEYNFF